MNVFLLYDGTGDDGDELEVVGVYATMEAAEHERVFRGMRPIGHGSSIEEEEVKT